MLNYVQCHSVGARDFFGAVVHLRRVHPPSGLSGNPGNPLGVDWGGGSRVSFPPLAPKEFPPDKCIPPRHLLGWGSISSPPAFLCSPGPAPCPSGEVLHVFPDVCQPAGPPAEDSQGGADGGGPRPGAWGLNKPLLANPMGGGWGLSPRQAHIIQEYFHFAFERLLALN